VKLAESRLGALMPQRSQHGDDDFTEAERRAIAGIRRELDEEFGPLEPAEPLAVAPSAPSRPPPPSPRPRARAAARAVPLFLLGALVGGAVGGISGALTTVVWLRFSGDRLAHAPVSQADPASPRRTHGATSRPSSQGATASDSPAAATREPPAEASLQSALDAWLEATRTGDIEGQMRFYPARVPIYYTWRDVTRQAVHAEKRRVFGSATRLEITTDTPSIEHTDGGARAVTRFRKRYVIDGPNVRRRGEVLQELRWARTSDGWRIVAERDAEVLSPGAAAQPGTAKRGGTIDGAR
jgi:hypothetical protein